MLWSLFAPCVIAAVAILVASLHPSSLFQARKTKTTTSSSSSSSRFQELKVPVPAGGSSSNDGDGNGNGTTDERTLVIEELSVHPRIVRVPHFLTASECETLRRLAVTQKQGLQDGYVDSNDGLAATAAGGGAPKKKMGIFDVNGDGRLSVYELIRMVDDFFESHVTEDDVLSMLSVIDLPLYISLDNDNDNNNNNGTVSIQDFIKSDTALMRRYFMQQIQDNPSKRSRHSTMAWLTETSTTATMSDADALVLESIRQRVALLTGLPPHVVHAGMELQVVHYPEPNNNNDNDNISSGASGSTGAGHYTAHYDSLALSSQPCCHVVGRQSPCRTCRMATILYSLSDVLPDDGGDDDGDGGGGHTAFPLAYAGQGQDDDDDPNDNHYTAESVEAWRLSPASREDSYCAKDGPGLRIAPNLGQAIFWYNHHPHGVNMDVDESLPPPSSLHDAAALLGELDRSTMHAGCPSTITSSTSTRTGTDTTGTGKNDGERWNAPGKWIANHWIEASDIAGEDEAHYAKMLLSR
jgi:hypothetical protein